MSQSMSRSTSQPTPRPTEPREGIRLDHVLIRPGRPEDEPSIREFTRNTFVWGDYVGDTYADWVSDMSHDRGAVYVAVFVPSGRPVGLMHSGYISSWEAWFEGIRVHPDFRRRGIAHLLTQASIEDARKHGIRTCRAAIDADNERSAGLACGLGFHPAATIVQFEVELGILTAQPGGASYLCPDQDSRPALPQASRYIGLRAATPEDVSTVYRMISREASYVGKDFCWWKVSPEGIERIIGDSGVRLACDESGFPVAGAAIGEAWVDEGAECPTLYAELSSVFGETDGIVALAREQAALMSVSAKERGLPCRLNVICEEDSPTTRLLAACGFRERFVEGRGDRIRLWELDLSSEN